MYRGKTTHLLLVMSRGYHGINLSSHENFHLYAIKSIGQFFSSIGEIKNDLIY